MYVSMGLLALIVLVSFVFGVATPILIIAHLLSRRGKVYVTHDKG